MVATTIVVDFVSISHTIAFKYRINAIFAQLNKKKMYFAGKKNNERNSFENFSSNLLNFCDFKSKVHE